MAGQAGSICCLIGHREFLHPAHLVSPGETGYNKRFEKDFSGVMRIAMAKIMLRYKHTISVNLSAVEFTLGWQIIDSKNAFILRPNTDSNLEAMQFIWFYI